MDTKQLIDLAMQATGETTVRGIAGRLGVSHVAIVRWQSGDRDPTFEHAAQLAQLAGLDPVQTAAQVRLQTRDGSKYRAILRTLARAAVLIAALGLTLPAAPTKAHEVGIMRSSRRWLRSVLKRLFVSRPAVLRSLAYVRRARPIARPALLAAVV